MQINSVLSSTSQLLLNTEGVHLTFLQYALHCTVILTITETSALQKLPQRPEIYILTQKFQPRLYLVVQLSHFLCRIKCEGWKEKIQVNGKTRMTVQNWEKKKIHV